MIGLWDNDCLGTLPMRIEKAVEIVVRLLEGLPVFPKCQNAHNIRP